MLGLIAPQSEEEDDGRVTQRPPGLDVHAPEPEAGESAPDISFDEYPAERCGAIAARLALARLRTAGDEIDAILRLEALNVDQWNRVHEHWLARIATEADRSRNTLLQVYDNAYVSALEAQRGVITLDEYAYLAEAAERNAVDEALARAGLPRDAWPRIHRLWIGRMVKDFRLASGVRSAINKLRAEG